MRMAPGMDACKGGIIELVRSSRQEEEVKGRKISLFHEPD